MEGSLEAAMGFQLVGFDKQEVINLFKYTLTSPLNLFEFTRNSLRSPKDIFNKGGNVTKVMMVQTFKLFYDNRIRFIEQKC
jgi:hypothetical protein